MSNRWYNVVVLVRLYFGLRTYWYHSFQQLILLAETKVCKQKRQDFHYSAINQITTHYLVIRLSSCRILFQYLVGRFLTHTLSRFIYLDTLSIIWIWSKDLLISFILATNYVDRNKVMQIKATRISLTRIRQPTR